MKSLSLKSLALAGALLLTIAAAGHASADDGRPPGPDVAYLKLRIGMMTNELKSDVGILTANAHGMQAGMAGR